MHALSTVLVLVFGGATLVLHDPRFLKIKPTLLLWLMATRLPRRASGSAAQPLAQRHAWSRHAGFASDQPSRASSWLRAQPGLGGRIPAAGRRSTFMSLMRCQRADLGLFQGLWPHPGAGRMLGVGTGALVATARERHDAVSLAWRRGLNESVR